jgi:hypothetical protein
VFILYNLSAVSVGVCNWGLTLSMVPEKVLSEDDDRIQSPKRCVLNEIRTMDNVQKHNFYSNYCCLYGILLVQTYLEFKHEFPLLHLGSLWRCCRCGFLW